MSAESNTVTFHETSDRYINIAELLLTAVQRQPGSGVHFAYTDHGPRAEFLTYPMLCDEARQILGGLRAHHGPTDGSKIALVLDRPRDFLPAFWACVLGGYVPCPIAPIRNDPDRWERHLAHVDALLEHPILITTAGMKRDLQAATAVDLDALRTGASMQ